MISAKTLSGEIVTLSKDDFEQEYLEQFVKEEYRPFTRVRLMGEEEKFLIVNVHPMLPQLEQTVNWHILSRNPAAIPILRENLDRANWKELCANPKAVGILKENLDKIEWAYLSCNPSDEAIDLFRMFPDLVSWHAVLELHPKAYELCKEFNYFGMDEVELLDHICMNPHIHPEWIEGRTLRPRHWSVLSSAKHMVPLLEKNLDKVDYSRLSGNSGAVELLRRLSDDCIDPWNLLVNKAPELEDCIEEFRLHEYCTASNLTECACYIKVLEKHPEIIDWSRITRNTRAGKLIEANLEKVRNWSHIRSGEMAVKYIDRIISEVYRSRRSGDGRIVLDWLYEYEEIICPPIENF
jgi:hypothetical protein